MLKLALISAVVFSLLPVARVFGWRAAATAGCLGSLAIIPVKLWSPENLPHPGVAGHAPRLYTFTVVLLLLLPVVLTGRGPRGLDVLPLLFLASVWGALVLVWSGTPEQVAGAVHYSLVVVAWLVGSYLARSFDRDGPAGRFLALMALAVVVVNLVVSVGQLLDPTGGFGTVQLSETGGVRVEGFLGHPADMGKVLLILFAMVLPLTRSADRLTRQLVLVTMVGAAGLIGLSVSRANLLGLAVMVVVWSVVHPDVRQLGRRLAIPLVLGIVILPTIGEFLARQRLDPDGGSRQDLTRTGLFQISQSPWTGTGPNSYISVVGQYDDKAALGLPVHNSFLLATAELGIPLAVLLFLPVAGTVLVALLRRRRGGALGDNAVALLALAPAMVVVGMTGWGLLKVPMILFWFFTTAFLAAQARQDVVPVVAPATVAAVRGAHAVGARPSARASRV